MDYHIVELLSNASDKIYPDNTLSCFTVFLPEQLNFEGEWEVALLEILHPSAYNNISEGKFWYVDSKSDSRDETQTNPDTGLSIKLDPIYIAPGLYMSLAEILLAMNDALGKIRPKEKVNIKWSLDNVSSKVKIILPSENSQLIVASQDLASILGFKSNFWLYTKGPHISQYPIDILRIHSVMVYTDIVEYSIIGDTKAPILRTFPFNQKVQHGNISVTKFMSYTSFQNLHFRKLLKNSFQTIKIELRSQTGELIPFVDRGLTSLVLLFRKKQSLSVNHP